MDRKQIQYITGHEMARITNVPQKDRITVFRNPAAEDEIDRIGKRMVHRLLEAGVTEPL